MLDTEQRSNDAIPRDVQIRLRKEECAIGMGQKGGHATVMGVQSMLDKEDCA